MKSLLQRLVQLDHLFMLKNTGTPSKCAQTMGLSERSLYDYIRLLKDLGAPITYSRQERNYQYADPGQFQMKFIPKQKD